MSEAAASSELMERVAQLEGLRQQLEKARKQAETERDEYKHLYVTLLEHVRKLEAGLVGQKSERHVPSSEQLTMDVVSSLVTDASEEATPAPTTTVERHERAKPTGRKPLPEKLPRVVIEVMPPDVQKLGLDAFHRIGEDTCETVEKRPASVVVVRIVRGKFVQKEKLDALEVGEATPVLQAPAVELPIPRGVAGPGLLADTVVKRWEEHQPLHRMERSYGREGYDVHRSTICGWHEMLSKLTGPLIAAMWKDARSNSPYLCTDATGVLVQHAEKCRRGHFFVVVAPEKHVLFNYSAKHDMEAVDELLAGFTGKLVADAHVVYHHLYETGVVECFSAHQERPTCAHEDRTRLRSRSAWCAARS